jgi:hypothetical protein
MEVRLDQMSPGKKLTCAGCGAVSELTGKDVGSEIAKLDHALEALRRLK